MYEIIKSTERNDEVARITYTVGPYHLTNTFVTDPEKGRWSVSQDSFDDPSIYGTKGWNDEGPETWGVNWSSIGTKSPAEANAYATQIMLAASVAEQFNKICAS